MTGPRLKLSLLICFGAWMAICAGRRTAVAELRAGAAIVDVTPVRLPVLVNGGMDRSPHGCCDNQAACSFNRLGWFRRANCDCRGRQLHDAATAVGRSKTVGRSTNQHPTRPDAHFGDAYTYSAGQHGLFGYQRRSHVHPVPSREAGRGDRDCRSESSARSSGLVGRECGRVYCRAALDSSGLIVLARIRSATPRSAPTCTPGVTGTM